jgi:hypothetical protein
MTDSFFYKTLDIESQSFIVAANTFREITLFFKVEVIEGQI